MSGPAILGRHTWDYGKTGSGHLTRSAGLHVGPSGVPSVVRLGANQLLYYHCWVENVYGNRWTHARIAGTSVQGWISNDVLDDGGSRGNANYCRGIILAP